MIWFQHRPTSDGLCRTDPISAGTIPSRASVIHSVHGVQRSAVYIIDRDVSWQRFFIWYNSSNTVTLTFASAHETEIGYRLKKCRFFVLLRFHFELCYGVPLDKTCIAFIEAATGIYHPLNCRNRGRQFAYCQIRRHRTPTTISFVEHTRRDGWVSARASHSLSRDELRTTRTKPAKFVNKPFHIFRPTNNNYIARIRLQQNANICLRGT